MPFIPHTEAETRAMLDAIDARDIEALFDEIPAALRAGEMAAVPDGVGEYEISRLMHARAAQDGAPLCFIGAGAYEHHIPAAVWEITTRGEFYSAYTPYQAEASQGTLQLLYEYQTMMAKLMALDVSNASLYDGASALAEAVLMAVRAHKTSKSRRVLVAGTVHPLYRAVAEAICRMQDIKIEVVPFDPAAGTTPVAAFAPFEGADLTAVVIQQPSFFGTLEDVHALTDWAHAQGALVIGSVNPIAMGMLAPPGEWGAKGADIACGEGQPLGIPLSSGGPYYGFMVCRNEIVRQMPGRIVGRTVDLDGKQGFALTLQAREQHIRRSKATSNICTNQGLMVTASTIHMAMLGPAGLEAVAATSHANTALLVERLTALPGVERTFSAPFFHECAFTLDRPAIPVLDRLADQGIAGGLPLSEYYPELGDRAFIACATEVRTESDIDAFAAALAVALKA
ncbi:MAG: aminomethyl-transferring glycine dehydrogenase subunit GcvPA [Xanthomonadaceae bacterium]|nr:aminomethyl-transferring glycine dehydrogenase subunit GcvPA [Xanthomonadaceae bacterium]